MYSDEFKWDNVRNYYQQEQQQFGSFNNNNNSYYGNKRRHSASTSSYNDGGYNNKISKNDLQRQKEQIQSAISKIVRCSGVLSMINNNGIKKELEEAKANILDFDVTTITPSTTIKNQARPSSSASISVIIEPPILSDTDNNRGQLLESDLANSLLPSFDQISRIPPALQSRKFFDDLQPLDRILARVVRTGIAVLHVELVCMLTRFRRNLLFMKGRFMPVAFDRTKRFYQVNDFVSTTVMAISPNSMELELQLDEEEAIYTHEGVPAYSRDYGDTTFDDDSQISRLRDNPNLALQLSVRINSVHSALPALRDKRFGLALGAAQLRKEQTHKLAMSHVVRGAELTRENKCFEAIQCFNKALAVDDQCADAYVGRGAACAGNRNFTAALQDLDKAVELQPYHRNANKYRLEVLMAYGRDLERSCDVREARKKYERALELHPGYPKALEALQRIGGVAVGKPELIELSPDHEDGNGIESRDNNRTLITEEEARKNREKLREMEEFIKKLKSGK